MKHYEHCKLACLSSLYYSSFVMYMRGNGGPYKYLGLFMKKSLHGAVCKVPRHVGTWWMMAAHHDGVEELSPGTWTAGVISDSRPPVKAPGCGHRSASATPFTLRSRVRTPFCASPQPLCPPSFLSLTHTDPFPPCSGSGRALCSLYPAIMKLISSDSQEPVWKKTKIKHFYLVKPLHISALTV